MLRCGVVAEVGIATKAGSGTNERDRAAVTGFDHCGKARLHCPPNAGEIHVEHDRPMFLGNFPREVVARDTRIGDDDIESTESIDAFGYCSVERGLVPNVGHMGDDASAFLFNESCGFTQVFLGGGLVGDIGEDRGARVDGDDVGALGGESAGMSPALAAGRAGNQHDLALEASFVPAHGSPSAKVSLFPTT